MTKAQELINLIQSGNRGALARAITIVENEREDASELIKLAQRNSGNAHVIGITGPPGAGKSTFINVLTMQLLNDFNKIGIIAVDPSSPFSGGALLGDRIRMKSHTLNDRVFMRSMGSRGSLGGLSFKTGQAAKLMDVFGTDKIIIETVGVGQSEVDIASMADTTIVVLAPGFGDDIQALKAGVLEIADLFVVNKCDNPLAEKLVAELEQMVMMNSENRRQIPVIRCCSTKNEGIADIAKAVEEHRDYLQNSEEGHRKQIAKVKNEIISAMEENMRKKINSGVERLGGFEKVILKMRENGETVLELAERLLKNEFFN